MQPEGFRLESDNKEGFYDRWLACRRILQGALWRGMGWDHALTQWGQDWVQGQGKGVAISRRGGYSIGMEKLSCPPFMQN